jgi:hypothetical protein
MGRVGVRGFKLATIDLLTPALKWNNKSAARWAGSSFWGGEGENGGRVECLFPRGFLGATKERSSRQTPHTTARVHRMMLSNKNLIAMAALLGGALLLCAFVPPPGATVAWNPSTSSGVAGYHLYYGGVSHNYTNMVDVGNATNATITGLITGTVYYFAVTAYNASGLESAYSNEASYTIGSAVPPTLQISVVRGQITLTGTGQAGTNYNILGSQNLTNWSVIGSRTASANGTFQFTDPAGATHPRYIYRLQQH